VGVYISEGAANGVCGKYVRGMRVGRGGEVVFLLSLNVIRNVWRLDCIAVIRFYVWLYVMFPF